MNCGSQSRPYPCFSCSHRSFYLFLCLCLCVFFCSYLVFLYLSIFMSLSSVSISSIPISIHRVKLLGTCIEVTQKGPIMLLEQCLALYSGCIHCHHQDTDRVGTDQEDALLPGSCLFRQCQWWPVMLPFGGHMSLCYLHSTYSLSDCVP